MSNKTLPSKRCIVKRSGAGGTDLAAGYSKPIFLSMDEHVSNFWAAGASFDSGTIKVQACPVPDAPQSSPLWQDVVMYPDVGGGRALSLSDSIIFVKMSSFVILEYDGVSKAASIK
jgi:hypothetical protein